MKHYLHRVYNLDTKESYTTRGLGAFHKKENLDVVKDDNHNWFYKNLTNMTQVEYLNSNEKHKLVFHYNNYVITRIG